MNVVKESGGGGGGEDSTGSSANSSEGAAREMAGTSSRPGEQSTKAHSGVTSAVDATAAPETSSEPAAERTQAVSSVERVFEIAEGIPAGSTDGGVLAEGEDDEGFRSAASTSPPGGVQPARSEGDAEHGQDGASSPGIVRSDARPSRELAPRVDGEETEPAGAGYAVPVETTTSSQHGLDTGDAALGRQEASSSTTAVVEAANVPGNASGVTVPAPSADPRGKSAQDHVSIPVQYLNDSGGGSTGSIADMERSKNTCEIRV